MIPDLRKVGSMAIFDMLAERGLDFINEMIFDQLNLKDLCALKKTNKFWLKYVSRSKSWNRKLLKKKLDIRNEDIEDCYYYDCSVMDTLESVLERNLTEELRMWGLAVFMMEDENPLYWAVEDNRVDLIENYYEINGHIMYRGTLNPVLFKDYDDEYGWQVGKRYVPTLFEQAAKRNRLEIIKIIVKNFHGKYGSASHLNKWEIDDATEVAITAATKYGHKDVVKYLKKAVKIQLDFSVTKRLFSAAVRGGQVETLMQMADDISEKINYPDDKCYCILEAPWPPHLKSMRKYCDLYDDWQERESEDEDFEYDLGLFGFMKNMAKDLGCSCDEDDCSCDEWEDLDEEVEEEEGNDETEDGDENKKILKLRAMNKTKANSDLTQLLEKVLARNLKEEIKFWADVCTKAEAKNPLTWAVENGNTGAIEEYYKLADLKLNPKIVQDDGKTTSLYEYAAKINQLEIIKIIFKNYPALVAKPKLASFAYGDRRRRVSVERQWNENVLIAATKKGNIDLIKYLFNDLKLQIKGDLQRKLISCAFREGQGQILKVFAKGLTKDPGGISDDCCFGCCVKSPPRPRFLW